MSHRRGLIRRRIGRVSIYEHHGSWHLYYRADGGAVRRKFGNSEAGAEVEASLLNARLVSSQQRLWADQGAGLLQRRVGQIADELPADAWHRLSVGDGAKGPREYDWAAGKLGGQHPNGLVRWMLARRSIQDPQERAYYLCLAPPAATGQDLAVAAGRRWSIECCFEAAKQETGLDEYEVRSWDGWYRHTTLSMLALAFLAAVRARAAEQAAATAAQVTTTRRKKGSQRPSRSGTSSL